MKRARTNLPTAVVLCMLASSAVWAADSSTNAPAVQAQEVAPGPRMGYFNPARTPEYNPYPYYNIIGGQSLGSLYFYDLPDENESPFNPAASMTWHKTSSPRLRNNSDPGHTATVQQPSPAAAANQESSEPSTTHR